MPRSQPYEECVARCQPHLDPLVRSSFRNAQPLSEPDRGFSYNGYTLMYAPASEISLPHVRVQFFRPLRFNLESTPTQDYVFEMCALGRHAGQTLGFSSQRIVRALNYLEKGKREDVDTTPHDCVLLPREMRFLYAVSKRNRYVAAELAQALWAVSIKPLLWVADRYPGAKN